MRRSLVHVFDGWFYPGFSDNWDNRMFRERILQHLDYQKAVLDLGAGAGIVEEMNFKGMAGLVCGVDPDQRVMSNPFLDQSFVGHGSHMPFLKDEEFDVVFSNNVLEHISHEEAGRVFAEVNRVLKPGGVFLTKTPNRHHYVPTIARMTPTILHKSLNSIRGREEEDTFKTHYAINTKKDQNDLGTKAGFRISQIEFLEGRPEYMRLSVPTYLIGLCYERIINRLSLDILKVIIITVFQKVRNASGELEES